MIINSVDFSADPEQGYWVDYKRAGDTPANYTHIFCGPQDIRGAECPYCHKPLLRILALDICDDRLNLQDSPFPILPLLFSWACNLANPALFYRVLDDGMVELLKYTEAVNVIPQKDFPYKDYPLFFPEARVVLQALTPTEQAALTRINHGDDCELLPLEVLNAMSEEEIDELESEDWRDEEPYASIELRHQVGGEPYVIQGSPHLYCPLCGVQMPFLALIANDCLAPKGFTGNSTVHMLYHYCRQCHVVGTYERCD